MNPLIPPVVFCTVFAVPALASVIGNAEKIACGDPADTAAREDRIKGICNTFRALLILGVLMLVQIFAQ